MVAVLDRVLARYVNLSNTFKAVSCTLMESCAYCFLGDDWYNTSVFFVLMVKPKLSHALENWSMLVYMSDSGGALRAQSSVNIKSRTNVVLTLVMAFNLMLKSFPSVRYLTLTPYLLNAPSSMTGNIMLKSVGARTQPCFTPLLTGKSEDASLSSSTRAIMPSWNWRLMLMKRSGHPNWP